MIFRILQTKRTILVTAVTEEGEVNLQKLANFISVKSLKKCSFLGLVPRLLFDSETNTIKTGFPAVHPKGNPIRIKAGTFTKLF